MGLKPIRAYKLATLVDQALSGDTEQPAPRRTTPARTIATFRGYRILLVEDNPVNQRVAQRLLQKLAADVILANNGAEALERLAEGGVRRRAHGLPDAGHGRLHRHRPHSRERSARRASASACPSSRSTANVMNEDREHCLAAGMDAHIGKPIVPTQLADCLSRLPGRQEGAA